ncbi:MAG: lysophospholipid acyltransferase family protein [Planctomycetota bacterium]|jgi:1-acyl-sn-glycerol-3-phosphate acyltransferase
MYAEIKDFLREVISPTIDPEVARRLSEIPNRLNEFGYDVWGFKRETAAFYYTAAAWLYRKYFRCETFGIGNVPAGRVLLIANHAGQLPTDGLMLSTALLLEGRPPRLVRGMVEKWFPSLPFFSVMIPRIGHVVGDPKNCIDLLENDEAVMVFPEGVRGSGKLWKDRYKLMHMGHGFVRVALRTGTPIVPVGIVGTEEQAPSFAKLKPLAKLLRAPYIPLSPTLGLPLPTKYRLHFGQPLLFEGDPDAPDTVVAPMVEEVRQSMRQLLDHGLRVREGIFR